MPANVRFPHPRSTKEGVLYHPEWEKKKSGVMDVGFSVRPCVRGASSAMENRSELGKNGGTQGFIWGSLTTRDRKIAKMLSQGTQEGFWFFVVEKSVDTGILYSG